MNPGCNTSQIPSIGGVWPFYLRRIMRLLFIFLLIPSLAFASSRMTLENGSGVEYGTVANPIVFYDMNNAGGLYGRITDGSVYQMPVYTSANTVGPSSILIDNGTNIGVGTSVPSQKLQVAGTVKATGFASGTATGISNSSSYWLCTASDCATKCQVTITAGLITGCT